MADQRRIVALNNHGVRLLQQRNHLQANQVLLQSLHKFKETLKRRRVPSGTFEKLPLVENDGCGSEDRPSCFATVALNLDYSSTRATSSSPHALPIFDRVFCFLPPGPSSQDDPSSPHNSDGSAAAILFNLAMTQQTRALHLQQDSVEQSRAALSQALRMYTWALSALQHWDRHATTHRGLHLLRIATLHNMAAAQTMMQQTTAARKTWNCLKNIFGPAKPYLERRDLQFFAANLLVVVVVCHPEDNSDGETTTTALTRTTSSLFGPAPAAAA